MLNQQEILALRGVPQPAKWHPEGDAYNHTLMVVEQAKDRFPNDKTTTLGAWCHDLGKALTQKTWPSHYGHADKGIRPTRDLLTRIGTSPLMIDKVAFITKYHMHIHDTLKMRPSTIVKICNAAEDITDEPLDLIQSLCRVGICDHYGREGVNFDDGYNLPLILYRKCKIALQFDRDKRLLKEATRRIRLINETNSV